MTVEVQNVAMDRLKIGCSETGESVKATIPRGGTRWNVTRAELCRRKN